MQSHARREPDENDPVEESRHAHDPARMAHDAEVNIERASSSDDYEDDRQLRLDFGPRQAAVVPAASARNRNLAAVATAHERPDGSNCHDHAPLRAIVVSTARLSGPTSLLAQLLDTIGEEATTDLIASFGGTRLYVPHEPEAGDQLSASIGVTAAKALARVYGGDRVDLPNPTPRRFRIVALRSAGLNVDAIARKLGCTRRRVFQVLAEARSRFRAPR